MPKTKNGEEMAEEMSNFVNAFGEGHYEEFAAYMSNNVHRTLQQNFMRLIIHQLKAWAEMKNNGRFDLRNEQTVELAKKIVDQFKDEMYLSHV